jgi:starch phosphorylase
MEKYFGSYANEKLRISLQDLLALGRKSLDNSEPFNMAYLAIRGSGAVNGVRPAAWRGEPVLFSRPFSALGQRRKS